jgi:uncharacterized protein with HEPN domain
MLTMQTSKRDRQLSANCRSSLRLAVRLKDEGERLCPGIDWKGLCGMGNVLRHGYHKVEDRIVWDAVKFDLPLLKACVDGVLNTPATDSAGPALG